MKFYNINQASEIVSLKEAVLKSITTESGLYMPESIPVMPATFFEHLHEMSLQEMAFEVAKAMLGDGTHGCNGQ